MDTASIVFVFLAAMFWIFCIALAYAVWKGIIK